MKTSTVYQQRSNHPSGATAQDVVTADYALLLDRGTDPQAQLWVEYLQLGISNEVVMALMVSDSSTEYYNKTAS